MRLYVLDIVTHEKIYLDESANTRQELFNVIGTNAFIANGKKYNVGSVNAEAADQTAETMALGSVVGVLGGVPGVIIGGIIGGLLGKSTQETETEKANIFNRSSL